MNDARAPAIIKAVTGIRVDDHNDIALTFLTDFAGDYLYLSVDSSGVHSSFYFDKPQKARTFFETARVCGELSCRGLDEGHIRRHN